jgi:hypothetical protein
VVVRLTPNLRGAVAAGGWKLKGSDNVDSAGAVAYRILSAIEALGRHQEMRRSGRVPRTRELVIAGTRLRPSRQQSQSLTTIPLRQQPFAEKGQPD